MKNANLNSSPIRICLQDSIFRKETQQFHSFLKSKKKKQIQNEPHPDIILSYVPACQQQPTFLEYINSQYFGMIKDSKPFGTGIMIDDEMNFFLSSWDKFQMNRLSLVKLPNETTILGTWINGKMQGWSCFCIKRLKIFIEFKFRDHFARSEQIFSTGLAIDQSNNLCYLFEVSPDHKKSTQYDNQIRLQIINRLQIPFAIRQKYPQNIGILIRQLFREYDIKIPHFLSSSQVFMNHFSQNNPDLIFKEISYENQTNFFLSIQDSNSLKPLESKLVAFNPYKDFVQEQRDESLKTTERLLGIILRQKSYATKSIGVFDSKYQLNGIGLTVTHDNTKLFGHFKSNLLTKELNNPDPSMKHTQSLKSQNFKTKLKQHHMKSLNFVREVFYMKEIESSLKIAKQVSEYVQTFENEYKKRYGKAIDSFSASEQSFEMKYQIEDTAPLEAFKRGKNQLNQNRQKRPFGKIVNSRSPLRSIPKSHSRSPSDIETFRQRRPLDFHYAEPSEEAKRSQGKNVKNLRIHTHSAFNSRFNQETSKNRSYADSNVGSISYKQMMEAKIRQAQQEDIAETVRRRTETSQRYSQERYSQERVSNDRRGAQFYRERGPSQRRIQSNTGYKSRYDRMQRRREQFWQ